MRASRSGCSRSAGMSMSTRRRPMSICSDRVRDTLSGYIRYSNDVLYPMWEHLEDAVMEGTHRWKQTYGT